MNCIEFRGEQTNSVINGSKTRYFSSSKRQSLLRQSYSIVLLLIFIVAAVTGGIYFGRFYLHNMVGTGNAALAASIANALSIQFFNWFYNIIAVSLNDRENHRYHHFFMLKRRFLIGTFCFKYRCTIRTLFHRIR